MLDDWMTEDSFSRILYSSSPSLPQQMNFSQANCTAGCRAACRGVGEELAPSLSSAFPSVVSLKREPRLSKITLLPDHAWHKYKHFAACSECQFPIFFLHVLQSWSEAPSLQPTCSTTLAQLIFPTLNRDVITAFLWCSLTALEGLHPPFLA